MTIKQIKKDKLSKNEQDELDYKEIREYKPLTNKIGFYVSLLSGLLMLIIGILLSSTNSVGTGLTLGGRNGGGGQSMLLSGPAAIFLGIIVLIFAVAIKRIDKKQKD